LTRSAWNPDKICASLNNCYPFTKTNKNEMSIKLQMKAFFFRYRKGFSLSNVDREASRRRRKHEECSGNPKF
jgi:hypothetical protein